VIFAIRKPCPYFAADYANTSPGRAGWHPTANSGPQYGPGKKRDVVVFIPVSNPTIIAELPSPPARNPPDGVDVTGCGGGLFPVPGRTCFTPGAGLWSAKAFSDAVGRKQYGRWRSRLSDDPCNPRGDPAVADIAPRKRLKEINAEIASTRDRLAALKTEREQIRDKIKAAQDAQDAKAAKPA